MDTPPTTKPIFSGVFSTKLLRLSLICLASSRVGARINPRTVLGSGFLPAASNVATRGRPKAAVLPVPVWAKPMTSLPSSTAGIAWVCMGVGSVMPRAANRFTSVLGKPISVNKFKVVLSSRRAEPFAHNHRAFRCNQRTGHLATWHRLKSSNSCPSAMHLCPRVILGTVRYIICGLSNGV